MSTTFVIYRDEEELEIAYRSGAGNGKVNITWINPIGDLLPDDMRVYPSDNTAQGVYTIGDLKKLAEE